MKNKINPDNFISMFLDGSGEIDCVNAEKADVFNKYLYL